MKMSADNAKEKKSILGIGYKAKGEVGYITFKKRLELFMTLSILLVAAIIFIVGLVITKGKGSLFTIIACLFVIPMARFATTFVLFFPFKSVKQEKADEVERYAKPGSIIYADVILTSEKNAMSLDFVVITSDKVIGVVGREKENNLDIRNYLQDIYKRRGYDYKVSIADDYTKFYSLLKGSDTPADMKFADSDEKEAYEKERAEVCDVLESLIP